MHSFWSNVIIEIACNERKEFGAVKPVVSGAATKKRETPNE